MFTTPINYIVTKKHANKKKKILTIRQNSFQTLIYACKTLHCSQFSTLYHQVKTTEFLMYICNDPSFHQTSKAWVKFIVKKDGGREIN